MVQNVTLNYLVYKSYNYVNCIVFSVYNSVYHFNFVGEILT